MILVLPLIICLFHEPYSRVSISSAVRLSWLECELQLAESSESTSSGVRENSASGEVGWPEATRVLISSISASKSLLLVFGDLKPFCAGDHGLMR